MTWRKNGTCRERQNKSFDTLRIPLMAFLDARIVKNPMDVSKNRMGKENGFRGFPVPTLGFDLDRWQPATSAGGTGFPPVTPPRAALVLILKNAC